MGGFVAELVSQLRTRNVDLDKLATFRSRSASQCLNQKEATQNMAKDVAQLLQSWLPAQPSADVASEQRILELEAELAKVKSAANTSQTTAPQGLHQPRHRLDVHFKDNLQLPQPLTLRLC